MCILHCCLNCHYLDLYTLSFRFTASNVQSDMVGTRPDPLVMDKQQHPDMAQIAESIHIVLETLLLDMPLHSVLNANDAALPALLHAFVSSEASTFAGFDVGEGSQDRQQLENIIDEVQEFEAGVGNEERGTEDAQSPVYTYLVPAGSGVTWEDLKAKARTFRWNSSPLTSPPPHRTKICIHPNPCQ